MGLYKTAMNETCDGQSWPDVSVAYLIDCYEKLHMASEVNNGHCVKMIDEDRE